jgi:hypothetical protein
MLSTRVDSRRARVDLRELYGKVPDERVEELIDRLEAVLVIAAADNRLRRTFRPFSAEFQLSKGDRGVIARPGPHEQSPIPGGNAFTALIKAADPDAEEFIAVVPGRLARVLTRRTAVLFVEHRDGTALEITVPFYVRPPATTKYSPARVRFVPPRVRPSATPAHRRQQPAAPGLSWPGWLKRH